MRPTRVMLVIGGNRGIGAAIARLAASRGYAVAITYASNAAPAEDVVAAIEEAGGTAAAFRCDVAEEEDILRLFEDAAVLGQLSAMVYSSGITGDASPLADARARTLRDVVAVNLTGAMLCAREAARHMSTGRGGQGGSITFVSSRAADRGSAGEYVWYAASKGGVNSLSLGLAREVAGEGIRVNCVSPGPVATEMLSPERQAKGAAAVAMGRVADPAEIAEAVLYMASDQASYVTGANLAVAGGA
ncbi:NAD(P)-dependent dehydrogenase (short-subunit alcohol dehydrogenase family) [Altererythrobacter atlanticus]|uniref:3-oxoacyl-[acyl-carrier-protein] reductase FabG n=1 Tax=Croceibacterium atlanticum TaxID=1267766 RepID=A0A0F7KNP4_9SPHN|nr:SDR family oxidoreductase [Croceibacterium atlanticum]AKH42133.1 3-oxoacyl-[acyl-carrier-protein] reductase FabG [Croceibacterium atlanticum]MBB5733296.1 NAD(P)-dependent dehydrogenase (short-subunit alcohol dehydrogenase family) [Croceibacterium atlanticum]